MLGDAWSTEQRGRWLSLYQLIPLTGSASGPIGSVFILVILLGDAFSGQQPFFNLSSNSAPYHYSRELSAPSPSPSREIAQKYGQCTLTCDVRDTRGRLLTPWQAVLSPVSPFALIAISSNRSNAEYLEGVNHSLLYFALSSFSALYVTAYGESVAISGLHSIAICIGLSSDLSSAAPSWIIPIRD